MKLVEIGTDEKTLHACAGLLQAAFPKSTHHTAAYLKWLYCDNPEGTVVGYNAWDGDTLIGHYAAIPVDLRLDGQPARGLLALHTAMHPDYRSAGVIYSLARKSCTLAASQGFACIYAVANAASTPIFVKALGFQFVAQLTAALGVSRLRPNWERALAGNRFRRHWTAASATWRAGNPCNPSSLRADNGECLIFRANTSLAPVTAYGLMPVRWPDPWPGNSLHAMRVATYAKSIGRTVSFALAAFRQAFAGGRDLTDPDNVAIAAAACELHPNAIAKAAEARAEANKAKAEHQNAKTAAANARRPITGSRALATPINAAHAGTSARTYL